MCAEPKGKAEMLVAKLNEVMTALRKQAGMSQQVLADKLGVTRSAIGMYETDQREPNLDTLKALADIFGVDLDTLAGRDRERALPSNVTPMEEMGQVPLLGRIACGTPILAEENIEEYVDLPRRIKADFALECKGDSMVGADIRNGDVVYIRAQPEVENGQIAAVLVDGDEATLKRLYFDGRTVQLVAENPSYAPMVFTGEEISKRLRVLGLAVAYTHALV